MNMKVIVKGVLKSVTSIIRGRTAVIEIDAELQTTNQIAARKRRLLHTKPNPINMPMTPLTTIDLVHAVREAQISHEINERRQRLNS